MVKTAETSFLETGSTSQEMFQEILKTIPVNESFAEVSFLASGIPRDSGRENFDKDAYLKQCIEKNVIPFSRVSFEYDWDSKILVPRTEWKRPLVSPPNQYDKNEKLVGLERFFRGGKIHLLEFKTESSSFGYGSFRDDYLQRVLDSGYEVDETDLWLSTYHMGGYNEGTYRSSGLRMGKTYVAKGVRLNFEDMEEKEKLIDWFTELAGKHNAEVFVKDK